MKNMFPAVVFLYLSAEMLGAGTCNSDIPVQWVLEPVYVDGTTPNALQGDGSPYVDGQNGVKRSVINVCSGTYDATLLLSKSRTISGSFARPLALTAATPPWAAGGAVITDQWFLNVKNILYVPAAFTRADEYDFTTFLRSQTGVVNYEAAMVNPGAEAPKPASAAVAAAANSPYPNSLVDVHHCPANSTATSGLCAGVVHETWFVWPDPNPTQCPTASCTSQQTGLPITQVSSLLVSQGNALLTGGEFSMPFFFVISTLQ